MNNNNDEFELDFNDGVVDMTDPDYNAGNNTYGTYNGNQYNNTYGTYNDGPGNNDIYGVYQPGRSYDSKAELNAAKLQKEKKSYAIINILYHIALFSECGYLLYFVLTKNYDYNLFVSMSRFLGIIIEGIFIADACLMYRRYKKVSLLITAIFFPFLYPFFRCSARSESKSLPLLWIVLTIVVGYLFVKDAALPIYLSSKGTDLYESKYDVVMDKFKEYKYDGKTETKNVMSLWFDEYKLYVKKEDTQNLYVELSGQTATEIQGVVTPDSNINPNTVFEIKVKKEDGSYELTSLRINDKLYNQYKERLWDYWFFNYKMVLPW